MSLKGKLIDQYHPEWARLPREGLGLGAALTGGATSVGSPKPPVAGLNPPAAPEPPRAPPRIKVNPDDLDAEESKFDFAHLADPDQPKSPETKK